MILELFIFFRIVEIGPFGLFIYSFVFHCSIICLIVVLTVEKRAAIISWWSITSATMQSLR